MPGTIALAGKGGTGKTTLSALIIRELIRREKTPVLAVDADPNNCLSELLGVSFEKTVVSLADDLMKEKDGLPAGLTKERYLELNFQNALVESSGFDLLVMGRPEREGCYCAANNMLRNCMENLASNYPSTVMDNEAGMEHLSRRTARKVDELLVIAGPSKLSLKSARRILEISEELKLDVKNARTAVNEYQPVPEGEILQEDGIFARIPYDPGLCRLSLQGGSVFELDQESPACRAVSQMLEKLGA